MNDKVKLEKYRSLSITALVMGLLTVVAIPQIFRWSTNIPVYNLGELLIKLTTVFILAIGLPLIAIITGSIDLRRIKTGRLSNKGKGFDITGVVLGAIFMILLDDDRYL